MTQIERLRAMIDEVRSDNDRKTLHATLDTLTNPKFKVVEEDDPSFDRTDVLGFKAYPQPTLRVSVSCQLGDHLFESQYVVLPYHRPRWDGDGHMREHIVYKMKQDCIRAMVRWMDDND